MSTRDRKDIEAGLERKGFERDERHHHYFVYWTISGKKTSIKTRTSHSSKHKDLDDYLIANMARQCGLRKSDFLALVDCPLTRDRFEQIVLTE